MFLICSICNESFELHRKDRKFIIIGEEFCCSKACIKEWIYKNYDPTFSKLQNDSDEKTLLNTGLMNVKTSFSNVLYKSDYEKYFAQFLCYDAHTTFSYEPFGFKLSNGTYTPDFWITGNLFFEVKGLLTLGFRQKLKRFRQEYPHVRLLLIPWIIKDQFYEIKDAENSIVEK